MKKLTFIVVSLLLSLSAYAQHFSNDFENQYTWYPPWSNLFIVNDSTAIDGQYVCICDSIHDYGFGFAIKAGTDYPSQNINCKYEFLFRTESPDTNAEIVFSIDDETGNKYWQAYHLSRFVSDTSDWSKMTLDLNFPFDCIGKGNIKTYIWNHSHEVIYFDNASLTITASQLPSYQPQIDSLHYITPFVEYIDQNGDTLTDPTVMDSKIRIENEDGYANVFMQATFKEDVKLLRLAAIMPLPEGKLTVYRRNQHIDTANFQNAYYLDREGFSIQNDSIQLSTYHNTGISSLQLNLEDSTACFNIDYWRDHPLIHYPMRTDTTDYFEDISYHDIHKDEVVEGHFTLYWSVIEEQPRIMPVWDGYESAFIFTEHADWTDIRTHRAVLYGNEHIKKPEDAVGGFVYFAIPVTKSVFYWNPDHVNNNEISEGLFPGLHATIKSDRNFFKLLKDLNKLGFEICLHTPEQYTTIPRKFKKAMRFMRRKFGTVSWIDHGYNNSPDNNREDLVCDGLLPDSPQYAADLWRRNGVRYLWNAYYEEKSMQSHHFNGHFVQPYDGFGDALPNRQITTLPNGGKDFLLWSTPSTLEVNEDKEWYYYFDSIRLQRLADQHSIFITHIYPAWSNPWRAFWEYNENGTAVAMPGFNYALNQLASFRDENKILPTTIQQYLSYYEKLLKIEYQVIDNNTIQLVNHGERIDGFTLLCSQPIQLEGKTFDYRKTEEGYYVWFTLNKKETLTIRYAK